MLSTQAQLDFEKAIQCKAVVNQSRRPECIPSLDQAREILRSLIDQYPTNSSIALELAEILLWDEALDEAIQLLPNIQDVDPKLASKIIELTFQANCGIGHWSQALDALSPLAPQGRTLYQKAMVSFQSGHSKQGFKETFLAYSTAFPRYSEITPWKGKSLKGENLLLTMHDTNGGGDELNFALCIPLAMEHATHLYVETEPRTFELYKNSFPKAHVFCMGQNEPWVQDPALPTPTIQTNTRAFTAAICFGTGRALQSQGHLKPSDTLRSHWSNYLSQHSNEKKKIGLSWRSYHCVGPTSRESLSTTDLEPLQMLQDKFDFFNLQYDASNEELEEIQHRSGLTIKPLPDLDQMKDLHNLAAVCAALDGVWGCMNTNTAMACAAGSHVVEFAPEFMTQCMGILDWYPNRIRLVRPWNQSWQQPIQRLIEMHQ